MAVSRVFQYIIIEIESSSEVSYAVYNIACHLPMRHAYEIRTPGDAVLLDCAFNLVN